MSALYNHNYSKITDDSKERGTATFPIPHPLLFCSDAAVIGTPFFCYEFVRGRFFKAPQLTSVRLGKTHESSLSPSFSLMCTYVIELLWTISSI